MRTIRFRLEDSQHHGGALDKDFGGPIAVQNAFYRLIEIETEKRRGIQSAVQQILSDASRTPHVGFYYSVINHLIVRGRSFRGQQEFVQAVIHARNFARALATNDLDSFHSGSQTLIVPQVAAQAHKIFSEMQSHRMRLVSRVTPQLLGQRFDALHGESPGRKLLENLGDALSLLPGTKRSFQLLQVNGRAIIVEDIA